MYPSARVPLASARALACIHQGGEFLDFLPKLVPLFEAFSFLSFHFFEMEFQPSVLLVGDEGL